MSLSDVCVGRSSRQGGSGDVGGGRSRRSRARSLALLLGSRDSLSRDALLLHRLLGLLRPRQFALGRRMPGLVAVVAFDLLRVVRLRLRVRSSSYCPGGRPSLLCSLNGGFFGLGRSASGKPGFANLALN